MGLSSPSQRSPGSRLPGLEWGSRGGRAGAGGGVVRPLTFGGVAPLTPGLAAGEQVGPLWSLVGPLVARRDTEWRDGTTRGLTLVCATFELPG